MEKLNSNSTFFKKYIFSIFLLILPIISIAIFIKNEFWIGVVIAFMALVILIGITKNYYWDLKRVYLDKENNRLIIEEKKEKIFIAFAEIEKVEFVKILSAVVVVSLKRQINNMDDFTFVPKNSFLFKNSIVEKLNNIISTAGNSN
jgi:hypothetical protein